MSELINQIVVATILFIITYIPAKINAAATLFSVLVPLYLLWRPLSKLDINPFRAWKGPSVLIPMVLFANFYLLPESAKAYAPLFTLVLVFNMLQPIFLIQLKDDEVMSKLNAVLLLILALYTPKAHYDESAKVVCFEDKNVLHWIVASCLVLGSLYVFSDYYRKSPWQYVGLYAILIPTLFSLITGNTTLWPSLRVYAIAASFLVLYDPIKGIYRRAANALASKYDLSHDSNDPLRLLTLIASATATALVVKKGTKNTAIEYIRSLVTQS